MKYYNFIIPKSVSLSKSNTNITIICYGGEYRLLYKYNYALQKEKILFDEKYKKHIDGIIKKQEYNKKRMFFTISDIEETISSFHIGEFITGNLTSFYADRYYAAEIMLQDLYK